MFDTENEKVVGHFFETLSSGDLEAVRLLFHTDAVWQVQNEGIPGAGVHRGRDNIIAFLAPIRGLFKPGDPKITVTSVASKGGLVIAEARGHGTLADGRTYDNRYAWALEVKDGLIVALREYMDSLYIARLFDMV